MTLLGIVANIPDALLSVAAGAAISGQVWQLKMLYSLKERISLLEQRLSACPQCGAFRLPISQPPTPTPPHP